MIRSSFYAFETARRAISNAQLGLNITGHNNANAGTPGYTRQRLDQVAFNMSYNTRYKLPGNSTFTGLGSQVIGITRIRDPHLDARFRTESSECGEYAVISNGLDDIAKIFDEFMSGGLDEKFSDLVDALTQLQEDPNSSNYASVVRSTAEQLTKMIQTYNSQLEKTRAQQHSDLETSTKEVNELLEAINSLNEKIYFEKLTGANAYELMDERDLLLDQLSEYIEIDVEEEKIVNNVTGKLEATGRVIVSVKGEGTELVNKDGFAQLVYDGSGYPAASYDLIDITGTTHTAYGDTLMGFDNNGGLKGFLKVINGGGPDYGTAPYDEFRGIAYCQGILDDFVTNFVTEMNAQNAANGGGDLFDPAGLTAGTFALDANWIADPLAIKDSGSNQGILAFVDLLTNKTSSAFSGPGFANGDFTFQGFMMNFQTQLGTDKSLNQVLYKASYSVVSGLANQRDAISAVSPNEEATNMMIYQNYYNAACRYMTVLDEALNTIINGMGVVGR